MSFLPSSVLVIYSMCHVEIFEQIKTDGWTEEMEKGIVG